MATIISVRAIAKITNNELVNGRLVYRAICLKRMSMTPNPARTAAGYIHLLLVLVAGFERISNRAGKPIKKAVIFNRLKSSLKISQAASSGMNNESLWAASVFTIPICFMEAAKNINMEGSKIPSVI
jgi:hypothetical protein